MKPPVPGNFHDVLASAISRRRVLQLGLGSLAVGFLGGSAPGADEELFTFQGVPPSTDDAVRVPPGYRVQVLYRWGDPVDGVGPAFRPDATGTAEEQARQAGMGHDGMAWFEHPDRPSPGRGLLCLNHEYADQALLFPPADGWPGNMTAEMVRKGQAAHGVSVVDVEHADGAWRVVPSKYARRITASTPMRLSGPAAALVGDRVAGTVNNCAAGQTPWGTYLTCEENFQSVFGTDRPDWTPSVAQRRYGLGPLGHAVRTEAGDVGAFRWWRHDARFDLGAPQDDSLRFGYVVEVDPARPDAAPVKRTALGRFRHENAAVTLARDGRVVVYMGDDERGEHLYKFVSKGAFDPARPDAGARGGLLDEGTLHAARFHADGTGEWLALEPGAELPTAGHVCAFTRLAADLVRPTRMDRPEWVAVHPATGEVYVTLTNNDRRAPVGQGGKGQPEVDAANPRPHNVFGHIVRWREAEGDAAAARFSWDVFLLAGDPQTDAQEPRVTVRGDAFGSPDGLWFDPRGILWIQTDVSTERVGRGPYKYLGNNMMLAADPRRGVVRRFLTGPRGCEITGVAMTPDRKAMFVNVQHPGESPTGLLAHPKEVSSWPEGPHGGRPRPATIVLTREDGGAIGT